MEERVSSLLCLSVVASAFLSLYLTVCVSLFPSLSFRIFPITYFLAASKAKRLESSKAWKPVD
jgi:hypothetical protein